MLKKTIIYFLSSGFQSIAGIFTLLLLQKVLSEGDIAAYAIFSVALSVFDSFSGMNAFGLYEARFYINSKEDNGLLISNLFYVAILSLVISLTLSVVATFVQIPGTNFSKIGVTWLFIAAMISNLKQFQNILLIRYQYKKAHWKFFMLNVSSSLVILFGTYLLLIYSDPSWKSRVYPQMIITIGLCAISLSIFNKEYALKFRFSVQIIYSLFKYGLPLIPHKFSMLLITVGGQIVIDFFLEDDVGLSNYFIALKFGIIVLLVVDVVNRMFAPEINLALQRDSDLLIKIMLKSFLAILVFSALFIVALTLGGQYFLNSAYLEALEYFPFMCLGFLFHGFYTIIINTFFFREKTLVIARLSL
ncbi:hypothetical protein OAI64_01765, partial [Schleiferiaceae bacterium]|nr:hypothetical protein [Schleiferiaceae bacterium]